MGDLHYEQPLEVRMDPSLDVSLDSLEEQQRYAIQIRDMQSFINDGLRALDLLKDQLQERKKTLESQRGQYDAVIDAIDEHLTRIDSILDILVRPEGKPFWSEGPRLMGRLSGLFRAISGVNTNPTAVQKVYFGELGEEFDMTRARVDAYLIQYAKDINKVFQENNVPLILIPEWKKGPLPEMSR